MGHHPTMQGHPVVASSRGPPPAIPSSAYGPDFGSHSSCGIWQVTPSRVREGTCLVQEPRRGTNKDGPASPRSWPGQQGEIPCLCDRVPASVVENQC